MWGTSRSKYRGVTYHAQSKKWVARCRVKDGWKNLGRYVLELDAAKAHDLCGRKHPEVQLNFPRHMELVLKHPRPTFYSSLLKRAIRKRDARRRKQAALLEAKEKGKEEKEKEKEQEQEQEQEQERAAALRESKEKTKEDEKAAARLEAERQEAEFQANRLRAAAALNLFAMDYGAAIPDSSVTPMYHPAAAIPDSSVTPMYHPAAAREAEAAARQSRLLELSEALQAEIAKSAEALRNAQTAYNAHVRHIVSMSGNNNRRTARPPPFCQIPRNGSYFDPRLLDAVPTPPAAQSNDRNVSCDAGSEKRLSPHVHIDEHGTKFECYYL